MTIELPLSGETFEAELKQDDGGALWLHESNRVSTERHAGALDRIFGAGAHHADGLALFQHAIDDAHEDDDAG